MKPDELKKRIEELDRQLVRLLNERTRMAIEIDTARKGEGAAPAAPARSMAEIAGAIEAGEGPLTAEALKAVYREILSASMALEREVRIAYFGAPATFTHQAARIHFGSSVKYDPFDTIGDIFAAVQGGKADYGVVPVENSTEGAVTHTLDQFPDTALKICAEIYLPISHNLLAKVPKRNIRKLYSHPQVFGQCRGWLHENMRGVELVSVSSTARAAEMAARDPEAGALASSLAAELYGLEMLAEDIQDLGGNTTRFLVLGKGYGPSTGNDKTSVFFGVRHEAGALYGALEAFKDYGLNMTKIESRPSRTKAWEYYFFVDFEGHADDEKSRKALEALSKHCLLMTVLGSYPNAMGSEK